MLSWRYYVEIVCLFVGILSLKSFENQVGLECFVCINSGLVKTVTGLVYAISAEDFVWCVFGCFEDASELYRSSQ
jgi:hypothetical protein